MSEITRIHPSDPLVLPALKAARAQFDADFTSALAASDAAFAADPHAKERGYALGPKQEEIPPREEFEDVYYYACDVLDALQDTLHMMRDSEDQQMLVLNALCGVYRETLLGETNEEHFGVMADFYKIWQKEYAALQADDTKIDRQFTAEYGMGDLFSLTDIYMEVADKNDSALASLLLARQEKAGVAPTHRITHFQSYAMEEFAAQRGISYEQCEPEDFYTFKCQLLDELLAPFKASLPGESCPEMAYLVATAGTRALRGVVRPKQALAADNDNQPMFGPELNQPKMIHDVCAALKPLTRQHTDLAHDPLQLLEVMINQMAPGKEKGRL